MLLAGCSVLSQRMSMGEDEIIATQTPVILPTQLRSQTRVEVQTCLVVELAAIQTDKPQGDLMAWSPQTDELAFVQPVNQYSGWYVGDLMIYDAIKAEEVFISEDEAVFGDVTWSPDGSSLAFVSLDQQEGIYTVKLLTRANGLELDIFGNEARTDDFASLKGIREWKSTANLMVTSYCGTDCVRVYQFSSVSISLLEQGDVRQNQDTSLVVKNEMESPDGRWLVSTDDKDNLWFSDTTSNQISLVLTTTPVDEVKWSMDSTFVAIRTADQVKIFRAGCTP